MIALMQPYFFPKLSYWQLIHSVDTVDTGYFKSKCAFIFQNEANGH